MAREASELTDNLTNAEARVYDALKDGQWHSYDALFAAVYQGVPEHEWPESNTIKVFICDLRRKISKRIVSGRQRYQMREAEAPAAILRQSAGG